MAEGRPTRVLEYGDMQREEEGDGCEGRAVGGATGEGTPP